jgi:TetR/AcrR family transcriptional regulator, transcriptional repressor of aconitase
MPKVSEQHRAAQRRRILDAARTCIDRSGLQAVTMQGIIAASGMSTGSVYGYFRGKDDIVVAAVAASLEDLRRVAGPLFGRDPVPGPAEFVGELTAAVADHSAGDGFDVVRVMLHGWGEALSNEELESLLRRAYLGFRSQLREVVEAWQEAGFVAESADPADLAATLHSMLLGFLAQLALLGEADSKAHARGVAALLGG